MGTEMLRRKAEWAEKKCNEASASSAPWAMANLRLYQNLAYRFWGEYYTVIHTHEEAR